MSLGAEHPASVPLWALLLFLIGVAATATGVLLHETGVPSGKMLILAGLPVAAIGGVVMILRRGRGAAPDASATPRGATSSVNRMARHLGLGMQEGRAIGQFGNRAIELWADRGDAAICVFAKATRDLDMGLSVTRGRQPGDARKEVQSGDASFDSLYCVRADEHARGQHILTDRLRSQLVHAHAQLDDSGAQLLVAPGDDEAVSAAVKLATKVAAELDRASNRVPCAESLQDARDAWLTFAGGMNLASANTPLSMWGEIEGLSVSAVAVRDAFQHFHFEITANFAIPLNRGLALKPASSATQFDRSGEPVGHPAFDKIFVLKATDPTDAARLVGPETRNAILELRDLGLQMRVRDEGLWAWVGLNRSEADLVPRGLKRMVQIASRIAANAKRFPPK